jgi:hypothetical protein
MYTNPLLRKPPSFHIHKFHSMLYCYQKVSNFEQISAKPRQ